MEGQRFVLNRPGLLLGGLAFLRPSSSGRFHRADNGLAQLIHINSCAWVSSRETIQGGTRLLMIRSQRQNPTQIKTLLLRRASDHDPTPPGIDIFGIAIHRLGEDRFRIRYGTGCYRCLYLREQGHS